MQLSNISKRKHKMVSNASNDVLLLSATLLDNFVLNSLLLCCLLNVSLQYLLLKLQTIPLAIYSSYSTALPSLGLRNYICDVVETQMF